MNIAYLSVGSNMGDKELNILRAIGEIGKLPSTAIFSLSSFYETTPVGVSDQPDFCNAAVAIKTALKPAELLDKLLEIETKVFKRKRDLKWGPRSIDLDILLYNDELIDTQKLKIPHPEMINRKFVLIPLAEIASSVLHPIEKRSIKELLDLVVSDEKVTKIN